eukprot:TRINITY_DN14886_c0_g1_i1.p1 TRINITY_DN14886_c0_g1~~TRINITY_DN14886_c0_g1_i1.p1  ORF type:complete len:499 (-),score=86.65 TRINITY_DN14886_c0_g1_i1:64-1560(-)
MTKVVWHASHHPANLDAAEEVEFPTSVHTPWPPARPMFPRPLRLTGFYEVKCAPGFRCISKLSNIAQGHDGKFDLEHAEPPLISERLENAYEWGCPARGVIDAAGKCVDDGKSGAHGPMCFSTVRYEAGQGTACDSDEKCLCVRPTTAMGDVGQADRSTEAVKGEEVQSGRFFIEKPAKCADCSQHDCSKEVCDSCPNCEFITKDVELVDPATGEKTTRQQSGCFKGPTQGEVKWDEPCLYLHGVKPTERELQVVPHYRLYDPLDTQYDPQDTSEDAATSTGLAADMRLPYQSQREPLGREEWIRQYREAAPGLQKLMDLLVMRLLDGAGTKQAWTPLVDAESGYRQVGLPKCWTSTQVGDDVAGKLDKFLAVQKACVATQETARRIARGSTFSADPGGEHNCGAYSWDKVGHVRDCGCHRGVDSEAGLCKALNCYTDREDVQQALEVLKEKQTVCQTAAAWSVKEIEKNGLLSLRRDLLRTVCKTRTRKHHKTLWAR